MNVVLVLDPKHGLRFVDSGYVEQDDPEYSLGGLVETHTDCIYFFATLDVDAWHDALDRGENKPCNEIIDFPNHQGDIMTQDNLTAVNNDAAETPEKTSKLKSLTTNHPRIAKVGIALAGVAALVGAVAVVKGRGNDDSTDSADIYVGEFTPSVTDAN